MGIIIRPDSSNNTEPGAPPLPIVVELRCDAGSGVFCRRYQNFTSGLGFIGAHTAAVKAGWLERNSSQGRMWLCPMCSGKG